VYTSLIEQFGIDRHGAHASGQLAAQWETKLTVHTRCLAVNWQMGKSASLSINALAFPISHRFPDRALTFPVSRFP